MTAPKRKGVGKGVDIHDLPKEEVDLVLEFGPQRFFASVSTAGSTLISGKPDHGNENTLK